MIDFQPIQLEKIQDYLPYLNVRDRGCEYSFVNLFAWGRQRCALISGNLTFFSQFNQKSVYLYPVGPGDRMLALEAIMDDARERGIPCRLVGLTEEDRAFLEKTYPGKFHYHFDRNSFDYVYDITDLAGLKGRKYQKKRNHLNRFRQANPDWRTEEISRENLTQVSALADRWYRERLSQEPHGDFHMERVAMKKALDNWEALCLEGLLLYAGGEAVAFCVGSRLSDNTFDVNFEKALDGYDGAYAAINNAFARHLQEKFPELAYLNREEDMGIEGLRKAKLSYEPHHMVVKSWACLLEEGYDY